MTVMNRKSAALSVVLRYAMTAYVPAARLESNAATMTFWDVMREMRKIQEAGFGSLLRCNKALRLAGISHVHVCLALRLRFMAQSPAVMKEYGLTVRPHELPISAVHAAVEQRDQLGNTRLMWRVNNLTEVRSLITRGADVNAKNLAGRTVLMVATYCTNATELVRELIDAKANVHAEDHEGKTALMHAAAIPYAGGAVARLIEAGADVNGRDRAEESVLHMASNPGNMESVRLLLAAKADDASKNECLVTAAFCCRHDMVRLLLGARADPRARNRQGHNSLTPVFMHGDFEMYQLLLGGGAR